MAVLCVVTQRQTGRRVQFSLVDRDGLKTHESEAQARCQSSASSDDVSDGVQRGARDAESRGSSRSPENYHRRGYGEAVWAGDRITDNVLG